MIPQATLQELTFLRDQVAMYQERERVLFRERDSGVRNIVRTWPALTATHARMLWALAQGGLMDRDQLAALCSHDEDADIRSVDSQIKRVRRKMPGITIRNVYGIGYELLEPWRERVRAAAKGQGA
jgi:DNA-binding response OmpR family regulator